MIVNMLFPEGMVKAFTLSYVDGVESDFRLAHIMRKNGVKVKYDVAIIIGGVLLCVFLMWAVGKLLGVDALFGKGTLKPNWVNYLLIFVRCSSLSYAHSTSDYTATYARLGHIDKNRAIQKIYTLWIVALAVIFISALFEEIYNKKREAENENAVK